MSNKASNSFCNKNVPFVLGFLLGMQGEYPPDTRGRALISIASIAIKFLEKNIPKPINAQELLAQEAAENFDISLERKRVIISGLRWLGIEQDETQDKAAVEIYNIALIRCFFPNRKHQEKDSLKKHNISNPEDASDISEFFFESLIHTFLSDDKHSSPIENIITNALSLVGNKTISKTDLELIMAFALGCIIAQSKDITDSDRKRIEGSIPKILFFIALLSS